MTETRTPIDTGGREIFLRRNERNEKKKSRKMANCKSYSKAHTQTHFYPKETAY